MNLTPNEEKILLTTYLMELKKQESTMTFKGNTHEYVELIPSMNADKITEAIFELGERGFLNVTKASNIAYSSFLTPSALEECVTHYSNNVTSVQKTLQSL